jgi:hypothetical protein
MFLQSDRVHFIVRSFSSHFSCLRDLVEKEVEEGVTGAVPMGERLKHRIPRVKQIVAALQHAP